MSTERTARASFLRPRLVLLLALGALLMGTFGCAFGEFRPGDPFDRQFTLDEAQHRYTVLVRFSEFQKAKSFIAEEDRDAFVARMKSLKNARFTGYESETVELDAQKHKATVEVTYTIYTPSLPYETEMIETQEWTRDGVGNTWHVVSTFKGLPSVSASAFPGSSGSSASSAAAH